MSSYIKSMCAQCCRINSFIGKNWTFSLSCVPLISLNHWTDHDSKNIRSVRNCMRKFIDQSDVKHIMTSPIKTIPSVLKASTDIITNITACHIGLLEILAIMSASTFKIAVILYIKIIIVVKSCWSRRHWSFYAAIT